AVAATLMSLLAGQLRQRRTHPTPADQDHTHADQLEAMLAGAAVGFAFFDRRQLAVRVNPALAELCSRPQAQLVRQPAEALPPAGPSPRDLLEHVSRPGRAVPPREWTGGLEGEDRTWMVGLFPVAPAGEPHEVEMVGLVAVDVSPLAQALAELRSRTDDL